MTNINNFGEPSGGDFIETHFDFTRCQRPDGSYYGTGGQCRKGTPVSAKELKALQTKAAKGDKGAMKELKDLRAAGAIGKEKGFEPGAKAKEDSKEKVAFLDQQNARAALERRLNEVKTDKERKGLKDAIAKIDKGESPTNPKAARALSVSGKINEALKKEGLPTSPPEMKRAVNAAVKKDANHQGASRKERELNERAKTQRRAVIDARSRLSKSDTQTNRRALDKAEAALGKTKETQGKQLDKMRRIEDAYKRSITRKAQSVSQKVIQQDRK